jgi:hypothetical protein
MLTDNLFCPRPNCFTFLHLCAYVSLCLCAYKLNMRNEPNFQKSGLTVTLDMIRAYNEN